MTNRCQGMNWIRREKRLAIYLRDGLACVYCGDTVEDEARLTLDHVKPYCKGGCNHETNLVTACHRCNSRRQDRPVATFINAVAGYMNAEPAQILRRVRNAQRRTIDVAEAKSILSRRSWVEALSGGSE
ncbi:MAG: HNH endonuclease signature motif containing protein [Gammaproteobacteria bacterium]|nr:HNH endonuclease signature motif containing protein [Gammaproteobacteria bacterium]